MAKTKDAPASHSRFTEAESERNSAIQSLAIKYFADESDWLACVSRATKEIDDE
jgi:hypothetical protein